MNILVVGKQNMLHWAENLLSVIEGTEHDAELFLINNLHGYRELSRLVSRVFARNKTIDIISGAFESKIKSFRPDLITFVSAGFIPAPLFEIAKSKTDAKLTGWIGDNISDDSIPKLRLLDKIFVTDSGFIDVLNAKNIFNVEYLPLAHNPKIFYSSGLFQRDEKIVFVGGYSVGRAQLLDKLTQSVTVIGKSWQKYKSDIHEVIAKNVSIEQVAQIYRTCGAVLNIKQEGNVINGLAMRAFEASACGVLVIHDDTKDICRCFEPGIDILTYDTPSQLDELIKNIKQNPDFYSEIAVNGCKRARDYHKYSDRLSIIIDSVTAP